ncbi:serine/threonine-protein kinase Nek3 isoform X2 [Denticeps clupeoides]|nr:serine/threonine-protein kinase Nek3 isoform X2 [Denticeps clupeoides]
MDGFSVLKLLGQGAFGRALLVQPKNSEEKCVVKEIALPKTRAGVDRSRREAVLLARMQHPNIVAFRDAFEADGSLYIVMEFCGGGDLLHRIRQQKNVLFTEDVILKWFSQMCAGTLHVHDKRVLHRDLKSKNVFLTDNGTVKLGDFGSACVLNSAEGVAKSYVGTPYYVSPEVWDNKPYNNKSDVWSLGCVLYELCTLRHPFQARSWKSLILKVCRGSYDPLPQNLPYELHHLVKNMLKTNPRDRPSVRTILSSHRVSRLLRKHLPSQGSEVERRGRWRRQEGEAVSSFLGQKSLVVTTSSVEGMFQDDRRRRWSPGPPDTVLGVLGNAQVISSNSTTFSGESTSEGGDAPELQQGRRRKRWDRDPPERLLSLLEKAQLSTSFRTYTIHRPGTGPFVGPLSGENDDVVDGPEDVVTDESRLDPRSDDDDT